MKSLTESSNKVQKAAYLYNRADIITEVLIYFTILWGPWMFGTVHNWSIKVFNIFNFSIGCILILKFFLRKKYLSNSYNNSTLNNIPLSDFKLKPDYRTKAVCVLNIYMVVYVLISIINPRATFDGELNIFTYNRNYINWLPTTYDKFATIDFLISFTGLIIFFWGFRDWILGEAKLDVFNAAKYDGKSDYPEENIVSSHIIPTRLLRILWLLCLNAWVLALVGILQRLDGTDKLLWIKDRIETSYSQQSFGPFGYRGNAASYLNMIIPLTATFYYYKSNNYKKYAFKGKVGYSQSHLILIPSFIIMVAATITTLSRGGFIVLLLILFGIFFHQYFKSNAYSKYQRFTYSVFLLIGLIVAYYTGFEDLKYRWNTDKVVYETTINDPNYEDILVLNSTIPNFPCEHDIDLFRIANSSHFSFINGSFSGFLYKNSHIQLILQNHRNSSRVCMVYTNLLQILDGNQFNLEVTRTTNGLSSKLNNRKLMGYEYKDGPLPPNWSFPIIPNEVTVFRKSLFNDNGYFQTDSISINPIEKSATIRNSNANAIDLPLKNSFNFKVLKSNTSSRDRIYANSWVMAKDFFWFGCGLGSWSTAYLLYRDMDENWEAWAHCDWLQYWICLGVFGCIPGIALFVLTIVGPKPQIGFFLPHSINFGLNLAIFGCLIHAIFDFPLHVLSLMHLFVLLCCIKMHVRVR